MHQSLRDSADSLDQLLLNFLNYETSTTPESRADNVKQFYLNKFREADITGAENLKNYDEIRPLVEQYLSDLEDKRRSQTRDFKFSTTTVDEQEVKEDFVRLSYKPDEYISSIGHKQHVRLRQTWLNWHFPKYRVTFADPNDEPKTDPGLEQKYLSKSQADSAIPGKSFELSSGNNIVPHLEQMSIVCYSDPENQIIDWPESINLLERYAKANSYSRKQIKAALLRTITKNSPQDVPFYRDLSPDSIATKLIESQPKINPKLFNMGRLKSLKRKAGTPLASILQRGNSLIELINPVCPENATKNLNLYLALLLSFTTGELKESLHKYINKRISAGLPINWVKLRNIAIESETNDPSLIPTVDLTFSQEINGKQSLGIFSVKTEQESEELRNRRFIKPIQQKPICVSNSNRPYVYWQTQDTSYRIDLEQLDKQTQQDVLVQEGKPLSTDNERLINELTRQLERTEISDSLHEKVMIQGGLDKNRKDQLIKKLSNTNTNPPTDSGNNQESENTEPPNQEGVRTRQYRIDNNEPLTDQDLVGIQTIGVNYTSQGYQPNKYRNAENITKQFDSRRDNFKTNYDSSSRNREDKYTTNPDYRNKGQDTYKTRNNDYRNQNRSVSRDNRENRTQYETKFDSRSQSQDRSRNYQPNNSSRRDYSEKRYNDSGNRSRYERNKSDYRDRYRDNRSSSRGSNGYYNNSRFRSTSRYNRDNRSFSRNRQDTGYRSNSRNRYNDRRGQNRYRSRSNSYGNSSRANSYSRDRQSSYDSRRSRQNARSYSPRRNYSDYRPRTPTYSPSRRPQNSSSHRADSSRRKDNYRRDSSFSRYNRQDNQQTRPEKRSHAMAMVLYKEMKPNKNCSKDYNPLEDKICSKCLTTSDHHEFHCPKYTTYNPDLCEFCNRGHHMTQDCDEYHNKNKIVQELINNDDFKQLLEKN